MKKLGGESGQTLVMVALSMAVLLGFAGFATDVGVMLHEKRIEQSAADSAAIAAALAMSRGGNANAAGLTDAAINGFIDETNNPSGNATVVISTPPADGNFAGQSGYAEAVITHQTPGFFMRIFGRDFMTISSRAVATDKGVADCCLCTLKPSGTTMVFQGSFHVNAPGCSVADQSNDPDALQFTGGAGSLTASGVSVVGGDGGQTGDSTPAPTTGASYVGDPWAGTIPPPTYGTSGVPCTATTSVGTSGSQTPIQNPGTVCYSSAGNITLTNVTLAPGTYVFNNPNGTLVLSGNITGTGVTLYLLGGMNETSGTTLNLIAPHKTGGAYDDILIYGAPSDVNPNSDEANNHGICPTGGGNTGPGVIQLDLGHSSGNFTGLIYAPGASIVFQDSGHDSVGPDFVTNLVVGTFCDETADLSITSYAKTNGGGRFPRISLVE